MFNPFKKDSHFVRWKEPSNLKYTRLERDVSNMLGERKIEIEESTQTIWRFVAISEEQFTIHYSGFVKRATVYTQCPEVIESGVKKACRALAQTMINRLPHDRPREEGYQVEQLWKYTLFCCKILSEINQLNRHFYNSEDRLLPGLSDKAVQWSEQGPLERGWVLSGSLDYLFDDASLAWLAQDDGKPLRDIMSLLNENSGAVDAVIKTSVPNNFTDNIHSKTEDSNLKAVALASELTDAKSEARDSSVEVDVAKWMSALRKWAVEKRYEGDGGLFIPGLEAIRGFVELSEWPGSIRQLQDCMVANGWVRKTAGKGRSKINGYFIVSKESACSDQ